MNVYVLFNVILETAFKFPEPHEELIGVAYNMEFAKNMANGFIDYYYSNACKKWEPKEFESDQIDYSDMVRDTAKRYIYVVPVELNEFKKDREDEISVIPESSEEAEKRSREFKKTFKETMQGGGRNE